jgi:hypothetical protein
MEDNTCASASGQWFAPTGWLLLTLLFGCSVRGSGSLPVDTSLPWVDGVKHLSPPRSSRPIVLPPFRYPAVFTISCSGKDMIEFN